MDNAVKPNPQSPGPNIKQTIVPILMCELEKGPVEL